MLLTSLNDSMPLYSAAQTKMLDRAEISGGTPGFELMLRAGRTAFRALRRRWPDVRSLSVVCGSGNNGGDGLVVAGLAHQAGFAVEVLVSGGLDFAERLKGEALEAYQWLAPCKLKLIPVSTVQSLAGAVVVDALLGTGLTGEVRSDARSAIALINASGKPVLALDIPSGLCSDSGRVLGAAVNADLTVSFVGMKRGLLTGSAVDYCGTLQFDDLDIRPAIKASVASRVSLIGEEQLVSLSPARKRSAHKGQFGHVLVVGGDFGMGGAALMAAEAALRSGAGLVSVATRPEHVPALLARRPELMVHGVRSGQDLEPLLARATHILIGPGLGQSAWSGQLLRVVEAARLPLVVDADALNLLGDGRLVSEQSRDNWVLTPHPGEAARLLGIETAVVQADRFAAATALQARFGGISVLKGAGTLVEDGSHCWLCRHGNPGMASGGMGDVLAGIIAGLAAQGIGPTDAARLGVLVHAWAGDQVAKEGGQRGLLATDLLPALRVLLNRGND